jgi:hypothetical protein
VVFDGRYSQEDRRWCPGKDQLATVSLALQPPTGLRGYVKLREI